MEKKHVLGGIALCLLLTAAAPLWAGTITETDFKFKTTRGLFDLCSAQPDDPHFSTAIWACRGFLEATVQYHDGVSNRKDMKRLICYPKGATIADGKTAFIAWGKKNLENEEYMNEYPVIGVVRALNEKYPCPE